MGKNDGLNTYRRVEIQLHAFSVSLLDSGKWLIYSPANLRPETFLRLPLNKRLLRPSASLEAVVQRKSIFLLLKIKPLFTIDVQ
jgi:hypothetical protein